MASRLIFFFVWVYVAIDLGFCRPSLQYGWELVCSIFHARLPSKQEKQKFHAWLLVFYISTFLLFCRAYIFVITYDGYFREYNLKATKPNESVWSLERDFNLIDKFWWPQMTKIHGRFSLCSLCQDQPLPRCLCSWWAIVGLCASSERRRCVIIVSSSLGMGAEVSRVLVVGQWFYLRLKIIILPYSIGVCI